MTPPKHRVALIHALEDSVGPARQAFAREWPDVAYFDLLDTSLAVDLADAGSLTDEMIQRFVTLANYASASQGAQGKAAAVLFTCSAFAPAIDEVKRRLPIPVLRPNESAFREALSLGKNIGLVVSFAPSQRSLVQELEEMAALEGKEINVSSVHAAGALEALKRGEGETHDQLVVEAGQRLEHCDTIVLGQFSMARAQPKLQAVVKTPVLSTPDSAVREIQRALLGPTPDLETGRKRNAKN